MSDIVPPLCYYFYKWKKERKRSDICSRSCRFRIVDGWATSGSCRRWHIVHFWFQSCTFISSNEDRFLTPCTRNHYRPPHPSIMEDILSCISQSMCHILFAGTSKNLRRFELLYWQNVLRTCWCVEDVLLTFSRAQNWGNTWNRTFSFISFIDLKPRNLKLHQTKLHSHSCFVAAAGRKHCQFSVCRCMKFTCDRFFFILHWRSTPDMLLKHARANARYVLPQEAPVLCPILLPPQTHLIMTGKKKIDTTPTV